MKTVYLVRHGESTENVRSSPVFQGAAAQLTERGLEQAHRIADRATRLPIEIVIASPYVRVRQTAACVVSVTDVPYIESDLFIEHASPASFIDRVWDESLHKEFRQWQRTAFVEGKKYEDGENFEDMRRRAVAALRYLEERDEKHIFVVTHGMFCRVIVGLVLLQDSFKAGDFAKLEHTLITRNTGITVIRRGADDSRKDADCWHMLTWNDHAHLG